MVSFVFPTEFDRAAPESLIDAGPAPPELEKREAKASCEAEPSAGEAVEDRFKGDGAVTPAAGLDLFSSVLLLEKDAGLPLRLRLAGELFPEGKERVRASKLYDAVLLFGLFAPPLVPDEVLPLLAFQSRLSKSSIVMNPTR